MKALECCLSLVLLAGVCTAQEGSRLQVRASTLLLADGTRVENGIVTVDRGKITALGADVVVDPSVPLIEHEGVLAPGFVACQSMSGARSAGDDPTRSVLSEARLIHAIDLDHSDFERALAVGITTIVVTPPPSNLSGGIPAVVKTHGGEVLKAESHLAISFSNVALSYGARGGSAPPARAGTSALETTHVSKSGTRLPTSYPGAKRVLEELLAATSGVFARVARGDLPVLLEAWDRNEVLRAAEFASAHGLRGALRGARFGGDEVVRTALAKSGLGVIVGPFRVGQSTRSLASVKELAAAGIPLAFALDAPNFRPDSFRFSAALALGAGTDRTAVWRGLTEVGAQLAGVAPRVGSLQPGHDADFVLWSGDPLNLASRVEAVYINGRLAWSPPKKAAQEESAR